MAILKIKNGDTWQNIDAIKGDDGSAATVQVGTTTTGLPGTQAAVVNRGTSRDALLDFTIPGGLAAGVGLSATNTTMNLEKATNNSIGGIIPPDGYTIDANGKLQENKFELIEKIIFGYSITTEQPTEGWYNGETLVEQDLYDTTFTPTVGTFYKHTGIHSERMYPNAIYYWNGTKYICYYKENGYARNNTSFNYNPLTQAETWEIGKYYQYNGGWNILVSEPSDWSTNWKSYFRRGVTYADWSPSCYIKLSQNTTPTFVPNTYWWYDLENESNTITRNVDINGTPYNFINMYLAITIVSNYSKGRFLLSGNGVVGMNQNSSGMVYGLHNGNRASTGHLTQLRQQGMVFLTQFNSDAYSYGGSGEGMSKPSFSLLTQHITSLSISGGWVCNDDVISLYCVRA